jgi:hypothetical protein
MTRALPRSFSLAALACTLAGCDPVQTDVVETTVADRTGHAIVANTNLAFVAEIFSFPPTLALEDAVDAPSRAVAILAERVLALNLQCTPELEISEATLVTRFGDDCRAGWLKVTGEISATVEIESGAGPCPSVDACATAVVWTIEDFAVQLGPDLDNRPRLSGPVELRDTSDASAPMSWTTLDGFTFENRLGMFASTSHATWTIAADDCITFTTDSRLDRLADADGDGDLEVEIGTIVLEADAIHRCPKECPDAGRLRLAYGAGRLLEWSYGDDAEVEITAPRGHSFVQRLQCL